MIHMLTLLSRLTTRLTCLHHRIKLVKVFIVVQNSSVVIESRTTIMLIHETSVRWRHRSLGLLGRLLLLLLLWGLIKGLLHFNHMAIMRHLSRGADRTRWTHGGHVGNTGPMHHIGHHVGTVKIRIRSHSVVAIRRLLRGSVKFRTRGLWWTTRRVTITIVSNVRVGRDRKIGGTHA